MKIHREETASDEWVRRDLAVSLPKLYRQLLDMGFGFGFGQGTARDASARRLSPIEVRAIRKRGRGGDSVQGLARKFGVSEKCIRMILNGETWVNVK